MRMSTTPASRVADHLWSGSEKWVWLVTLSLGATVVYTARTIMPVCILSISKEFGWTKTDAGSVLSVFYWGYCMTQVLGGYLADRYGGEKVILASTSMGILLTFFTPHLFKISKDIHSTLCIIAVSRFMMGCTQGLHYPSMISFISDHVSDGERAHAISVGFAGGQIGTILMGSVGSLIQEAFGWRSAFVVVATWTTLWLLFLRFYLVGRLRPKRQLPADASFTTLTSSRGHVPWMRLFKNIAFWAMVLAHFCHAWIFHVYLNWMPTYFGETFPYAKGWIFNVVPWLPNVPLTICCGWLGDYVIKQGYSKTFTRKLFTTISLAVVSSVGALTCSAHSYEMALFYVTLTISLFATHAPGILLNPNDIAPKYSGTVWGLMNTMGAVPGFVAVYIVGYILQTTHSWTLVFLQSAAVGYAGWIVYSIFGTGDQII